MTSPNSSETARGPLDERRSQRRRSAATAAAVAVAIAVLAIVHELSARWLDSMDLVERLLSPTASSLWVIPLALAFYLLRIGLLTLAPGVLLYAVGVAAFVHGTRSSSASKNVSRSDSAR